MNLTTTDSQATGFPLVIPTLTQQPTARLQLRNSQGQVIQQWLVRSNKCTLGSAVSCSLRCELPGVAPYHALLVIGARQIFIRALAPKLTRDGQPFNELLLTNEDSHFEIAGHRFELSRNNTEIEPAARVEASSPQRIKFTLARPFELRNRPQAAPVTHVNAVQQAAEMLFDSPQGGDSKWVAQLIQAAMQPLECQIHNLVEPLSELQRESRKQRRMRRRRAMRKRNAAEAQPDTTPAELSPELLSQRVAQAQLSEQVEALVGTHSAAMEVLAERVSEVNQQLQTIERIVAEQRQANQDKGELPPIPDSPQLILQSAAIEQLQQSVLSVSSTLERLQAEQSSRREDDQQWQAETLERLQSEQVSRRENDQQWQAEQVSLREDDQQWKDGLHSQLGSLAQDIEGLSASVTEVQQLALLAAAQPAAYSQPEYAPQTVVDSQPVSNWQPDANLQAASEALAASDTLLSSLSSNPEDWGLATDEVAHPAMEAEQSMWSEIESDDAIADPAAEIAASDESDSAELPELVQLELAQPAIEAEQPMWLEIESEDTIVDLAAEIAASDESDSAAQLEIVQLELAQPAVEAEQPMWLAIESDDAIADLAAEIEAGDESDSSALPELVQPELAQPAVEAEQPEWSALEPDDAIAKLADEIEANATIAEQVAEIEASDATTQAGSASLPSWWADDESDGELQTNATHDVNAEIHSNQIVDRSVEGPSETDDRASESPDHTNAADHTDERVYESISDCDERISESVYPAKRPGSSEILGSVKKQSEEFFGLAQLDLEEHLCAAGQLPVAPLPIAHEAEDPADEKLFEEPSASLLGHASQTVDANVSQAIEEQLIGYDQPDVSPPEVVLDESRVEENATENASEIDETDSVEEYMRKLLARMRGVPEEEVQLQQQVVDKPTKPTTRTYAPSDAAGAGGESNPQSAAEQPTANYASDTISGGVDVTEPFDLEKYMPRALAPERSNSLAAMRELANSSARTAIHKSTRQRHVSSIALKSVIACVGLAVGLVLLAINGLSLNIGLVATVASFMVAVIWGYDSISSIRPMLQNGLILQPQAGSPTAQADEQDEDQSA